MNEQTEAVFDRMRNYLADRFDWSGMDEDNTVECLQEAFAASGGVLAGDGVTIDPEDREAVERLHSLYESLDKGVSADDMQAALREYANPTPPRPDEPQGLGAVVEDDGEVWVRTEPQGAGWCPSGATGSQEYRCWADFSTAVHVLSPGVVVDQ